ncbi:homologous-pairing protein 2 [Monosporozyma unispora]|nr:hypothetical protein C6P44_004642 [Kazachstania unispora]
MAANKVTTTPQEDEDTVEKYLTSQLKPFSINDLVLNLNNKFKKTPLLKILDDLVEKEKIVVTIFGKTSIYSAKDIIKTSLNEVTVNNENLQQPNENPLFLAEQILQLKEEQTEINNSLKQLNSFIEVEGKNPSNQDLPIVVEELEETLNHLKQSLVDIKSGNNNTKVNKDLIANIEQSERILTKELKMRSRISKDIIGVLMQNNDSKSLKELLENIGFEEVH